MNKNRLIKDKVLNTEWKNFLSFFQKGLFVISFYSFVSMPLLSEDIQKSNPNDSEIISTEAEKNSKARSLEERFNVIVKSIGSRFNYFFTETLGLQKISKKLDAYLDKELKPSIIRESKHRFIFTPFNLSTHGTYTLSEQHENSYNATYSSLRSEQAKNNYSAYSRPQFGGSYSNYNQLEYRLHDRLRLFYINRNRIDDYAEGADAFTLFDYRDRFTGQLKNYAYKERQERIGVSFYHPITSFLNLGAMYSRYNIQQKYNSESYTIMYSDFGFGGEKSKTSFKANVPGLGFEFYPIRILINLSNFELNEKNSFLESMQITYTNEILKAENRHGIAESYSAFDSTPDSSRPNNRTYISPIYTYSSYQYYGNIENIAIVLRFFNLIGVRLGSANETYQKKYDYYLRFPFTQGLNNPQNLNPLSTQEILLESIAFSTLAKTKFYYKETYFRIEFSLNFDNFFGAKSSEVK
jgi:hypothetical protein